MDFDEGRYRSTLSAKVSTTQVQSLFDNWTIPAPRVLTFSEHGHCDLFDQLLYLPFHYQIKIG